MAGRYDAAMRRARSPAELGLTWYDRRRLSNGLRRVHEARVYRRVQAVLWIAQGRSIQDVVQLSGLSRPIVYGWLSRYLCGRRIDDFYDAPRGGRPPSATVITDARILRELERDPMKLGYSTTDWTVPLLAKHLSELYGCPITPHTQRRRMRQMDLRWKRPRYIYAHKDPHRAQKKGGSFAV